MKNIKLTFIVFVVKCLYDYKMLSHEIVDQTFRFPSGKIELRFLISKCLNANIENIITAKYPTISIVVQHHCRLARS